MNVQPVPKAIEQSSLSVSAVRVFSMSETSESLRTLSAEGWTLHFSIRENMAMNWRDAEGSRSEPSATAKTPLRKIKQGAVPHAGLARRGG